MKAAVEAAEPLGDHDHRLAICLSGLGTVYGKQARDAEAEPRFQEALTLREKSLPGDHPEIAEVLDHYAALLRKTGRVDEAKAMASRAQEIRKK
jgi:hypothetical protein